jgi:SpoVK/Ycf46/Vps4 family AAA+-type ATPase
VAGSYPALRQRLQTVAASLRHQTAPAKQTAAAFRAPSGLLLHGPAGSGKSHLAQCVVAQAGLGFLEVDATSIFSRYLGQTEANLRDIFRAARAMQPCVLLLDHVDALARSRSAAASSTGVEERALSQLLNEMDGIEASAGVFYIGCTNLPLTALDSAVLRPGRSPSARVLLHPALSGLRSCACGVCGVMVWCVCDGVCLSVTGRFEVLCEVPLPSEEDRAHLLTRFLGPDPDADHVASLARATPGTSAGQLRHIANSYRQAALEHGTVDVGPLLAQQRAASHPFWLAAFGPTD